VLCVLADVGVVPPQVVRVVAVPLGPIGLTVGLLLLIVGGGVAVSSSAALPLRLLVGVDAVVLAAVLVIARLNVVTVRRVRQQAAGTPAPAPYRSRMPIVRDRILGIGVFITAGMLYVLLCFLAGFFALLAGGVDVPAPADQAAVVRAACEVAWLLGSVAAVVGVVIRVTTAQCGLAMLRWALADLAVQAVALIGLIAVATTVSA
jgi:hypothetical protein